MSTLGPQYHSAYELWGKGDEALMRRASSAFNTICNYSDESHGGSRFIDADIARVREAGKHLQDNIRDLKDMRENVQDGYQQDVRAVRKEAVKVVALCVHVLHLIDQCEQDVPSGPLTKKMRVDIEIGGPENELKIKGAASR